MGEIVNIINGRGIRATVFVSHSSTDTWVARQISEHLKKAGASSFLDEAQIESGDDFEGNILEALSRCGEMLVLLTPWSLKRPYIWLEIGAAWGQKKRIVAILHGITKQELTAKNKTPVLLKKLQLRDINEIDSYFKELATRIKGARRAK